MAFGGPRPSRRALRAAPGLPQGLDAVTHGRAFRLRQRSRAALRRKARLYAYAGGASHSARRLRSLAFLCSSREKIQPKINANERKSIHEKSTRMNPPLGAFSGVHWKSAKALGD